jgi:glycosyltransferase involved in cell wall biosynthesis
MRIAYMLTSLGIGGAERQVIALAERMAACGHDVALIVLLPEQKHEWPAGVEVVRLNMTKSPLGAAAGLARGRSFLRRFKPDLVHSHTFHANLAARMLRLIGGPKVLSTIHNIYEGGWQRTLAYRLTDGLSIHTAAVSQAVADRYVNIGAVARPKCSVANNGIDTGVFSPSSVPTLHRVHKANEFVWLAAGRAVPAKDFDNLLDAFRLVHAKIPESQLWIAGDLQVAQSVRNRGQVGAECCDLDGVRWLGLCGDMAATIARADAFVLSSAWEGMPLVVGEAMAMEKPVVATDVGGVRELVGDAGVLVPAKDPVALAAAMLRVMQMPDCERGEIGNAARARIVENFDMNAKADEWDALYTRLLSGRG